MNGNFRGYFYSLLLHFFLLAFFSLLPMFKKTKNIEYPVVFEVSIAPKISEENIEKKSDVAVEKEGIKKEEIKKEEKKDTLKTKSSKKEDVIKSQGISLKTEGGVVSFSLKTEGGVVSSFYLNIVLNKIAENWDYLCENTNLNLKAVIFFKVKRDGKIEDVKIEKSSGKSDYDGFCMRAVLLTKNLPPLPDEFQADVLKIHLEFEYKP